MKRYRLIIAIALTSSLAMFLSSCSKEQIGDEGKAKVPKTTKILEESDVTSALINIDSTNFTMTFVSGNKAIEKLEIGDIIISSKGEGILRKVANKRTENGNIVVTTEPASLTEAVESGELLFNAELKQTSLKSVNIDLPGCKVLSPSEKSRTDTEGIAFNIVETDLGTNGKISLSGSFSLLPSMQTSISISNYALTQFSIDYSITESLSLEALAKADLNYSPERRLATLTFGTITAMMGPVPLVITPQLEVFIGATVDLNAEISTNATQEYGYSVGLKYETGSGWSTTQTTTESASHQPPKLGRSALLKVYIRPELKLKFYGAITPRITAEISSILSTSKRVEDCSNCWWGLWGSIKVNGGVNMKILGQELVNYEPTEPFIQYEWLITNSSSVGNNQPPALPSDPKPIDGSNEIDYENTQLSWKCSDPDQDPLTYDLHFGLKDNMTVLASDLSNTSYNVTNLNFNSQYKWKVVAKDDHGNLTEGPVWGFLTAQEQNDPPTVPANPTPKNAATGIGLITTLEWTCSDPDGDPVSYDIFLGKSSTPDILATNIDSKFYQVGVLEGYTYYYWKVIAKDNRGNATEGPVWRFRTVSNSTPSASTPLNPINQAKVFELEQNLYWRSVDTDNDAKLYYDVFFGTNSTPEQVSADQEEPTYRVTNLQNGRTYYWKVDVTDQHGAFSEGPAFSFTVCSSSEAGKFTDSRDGKSYNWVKIGNQTWMGQNLNYNSPGSLCYNNSADSCAKYGRLYHFDEAGKVCPPGWHLPSDIEWKQMETALGISSFEIDNIYVMSSVTGFRNNINFRSSGGLGKKNRSAFWWEPILVSADIYMDGTNETGFNALPSGFYDSSESSPWRRVNQQTGFWSSTLYSGTARVRDGVITYYDGIARGLVFEYPGQNRVYIDLTDHISVRCIKD